MCPRGGSDFELLSFWVFNFGWVWWAFSKVPWVAVIGILQILDMISETEVNEAYLFSYIYLKLI